MKRCIKCSDELTDKELEIGKEKCATCLVKGYKFVLRTMHREIEQLQKELAALGFKKRKTA